MRTRFRISWIAPASVRPVHTDDRMDEPLPMSEVKSLLLVLDDNMPCHPRYASQARHAGYDVALASDVESFKTSYFRSTPTVLAVNVMIGGDACGDALDFLARCRCNAPLVLTAPPSLQVPDRWERSMRGTGLRIVARLPMTDTLSALGALLQLHRHAASHPAQDPGIAAASMARG